MVLEDARQGSGVRGQYSHVRVSGGTFDLQVHCHVAFLPVVQPAGPQAEVHLRGSFHLSFRK